MLYRSQAITPTLTLPNGQQIPRNCVKLLSDKISLPFVAATGSTIMHVQICRQYCSSYTCSPFAYLITVTRTGSIGLLDTGASAAAVHWAVKFTDGDGVCAVRVVIALHTHIPNTCKQVAMYVADAVRA